MTNFYVYCLGVQDIKDDEACEMCGRLLNRLTNLCVAHIHIGNDTLSLSVPAGRQYPLAGRASAHLPTHSGATEIKCLTRSIPPMSDKHARSSAPLTPTAPTSPIGRPVREIKTYIKDEILGGVHVESVFVGKKDRTGNELTPPQRSEKAARAAARLAEMVMNATGTVYVFTTQQNICATALRTALAMAKPIVFETRKAGVSLEGETYYATRTCFVVCQDPISDDNAIRALGLAAASTLWSQ